MYANDTCGGNEDVFAVTQSNVSTCMAVTSDKTSLQVTQNSGCVVETWSGSNCEGSSYNVTDLQCHAVLYAAVSVDC
ncbi:uncharacterized protein BO66DRAFT_329554 [Aspergillus aculeatinus CBS 121060]|uniref:Uncharacterized protein n=2 Tax=Aspergillus subgen. Circumdati TaxID=2720871 RepID=A0ACD1H0T2_9EURO|nr:hypothetical protein BO95DRAFT_358520 [Aspergillus brunneoviolaceus CBS 621.78]XP_025501175.1 hypothetical protein BO66DRAFT_329554 [Aspergillus aculeatinus CBS 121060]RAH47711.1 hypothetical protein BO95DRAFT_358520 [Aspergillus brunneoviolaceus CBS 621.78]RAH67352.1 hypothetical protein BO66DRAFT_329554 [Aspergillus aculeatinus CBS 121060]